jgi:hypothetical protein
MIRIKNRDDVVRKGTILANHIDTSGKKWVTVLCENDDVETLPIENILNDGQLK